MGEVYTVTPMVLVGWMDGWMDQKVLAAIIQMQTDFLKYFDKVNHGYM